MKIWKTMKNNICKCFTANESVSNDVELTTKLLAPDTDVINSRRNSEDLRESNEIGGTNESLSFKNLFPIENDLNDLNHAVMQTNHGEETQLETNDSEAELCWWENKLTKQIKTQMYRKSRFSLKKKSRERKKSYKNSSKSKQITHSSKQIESNSPTNESCYDINGDRDIIIINISDYDDGKGQPRYGSQNDTKLLEKTFSKRNFSLFKQLDGRVLINDVNNTFDAYLNSNRMPKIITVAVMAHGSENDNLHFSNGVAVPISKIMERLLNSPKLAGVPKLFICQFCRGTSMISTSRFCFDSSDDCNLQTNTQADIMYFFATATGNQAYRDPESGSPFIAEFCDVFIKMNKLFDMELEIKSRFKKKKFPYVHDGQNVNHHQMPFVYSSLTKNIIFESILEQKPQK